jgi:hypothetical protein
MKNKFSQIVHFFTTIDYRHLQFAFFLVAFAISVITKAPSDGGTDPF